MDTIEQQRRRREELYGLLGDLPSRAADVGAKRVGQEERGRYVLEKLVLDLNGIELVPAYFIWPREAQAPVPVVLYNHAHGGDYGIGKEELVAGRPCLQQPPYADEFANLGWAALCIDAWAFGERQGLTEGETFRDMLWNGQVMWGMMVYDSLRALDYLSSRPDIDVQRIATLGMSMGSTMAWWLAALDSRVRVCVDLCCLTDFDALVATRGLEQHSIYYYVPGLRRRFSTAAINRLIAPRPHLSIAGIYDRLTPRDGLDRIDSELRDVYDAAGASAHWRLSRYATGHLETAAMRAEAINFLREHLDK
jgi:dienelactone hydrolase